MVTSTGKCVVEGVNIKTKHIAPRTEKEVGSIKKSEYPIHHSNVMLYSKEKGVRSRVGSKVTEEGKKVGSGLMGRIMWGGESCGQDIVLHAHSACACMATMRMHDAFSGPGIISQSAWNQGNMGYMTYHPHVPPQVRYLIKTGEILS